MPIHAPTTAPTKDPVPTCGLTTVEGGAVGGGAVGDEAVWKENVIGRFGPVRDPDPLTCGHAANESVHSCTKLSFIIINSSLKLLSTDSGTDV